MARIAGGPAPARDCHGPSDQETAVHDQELADLREQLVGALTEAFEREMRRGTQRIDDTGAPFGRFVRAESEKITTRRDRLSAIEADILGLQTELDADRAAS